MLNICKELGVVFRAHVKSHKTTELSKLQVGEGKGAGPANFIVSTIIEAENLLPCLLEEQGKGKEGSVSILSFDVLMVGWLCAISLPADLSCQHSLLTILTNDILLTLLPDSLWNSSPSVRNPTPHSIG